MENRKHNYRVMSQPFRSAAWQAKAEEALEQEKLEARVSALHELRWGICRIIDDLIAHEEQECNQDDSKD